MAVLRLDKMLSVVLCETRSNVKKLIRSGCVTVDGKTVKSCDEKIDTASQSVCCSGKPLVYNDKVYILMNKPAGVVCATQDECTTVLDILPDELKRNDLFPVGRLDKDTTGLLIITNDGDYAHKVTSPNSNIVKRYLVELEAPLTLQQENKLKSGVTLKDGSVAFGADVEICAENRIKIVLGITQGKYHQVKRMVASVGNRVVSLKRLSIGNLKLDENITISQSKLLINGNEQKVFMQYK